MAINPNARYTVKRFPGVAFYFAGYPQRWKPYTYAAHYEDCMTHDRDPEECCNVQCETGEGEWVDDDSGMVLMVMVGDDHKYKVDEADCTEIAREVYCGSCGQIGCTHDGYDREA